MASLPNVSTNSFCSDPNCKSCKQLREMQQSIRLHRPLVKSTEERDKTELNQRGIEYRALPSIQKAADDPNHICNNEAQAILREWKTANNLREPRRKKRQIQVRKRMMKFVRHYPI